MSNGDASGLLRDDLCMITDLAAAFCLAPFGEGDQVDPVTDAEARELTRVAYEIRDKLHEFLTDDVRADITQLINHLEANRESYRRAVLRWVDLLESLAYYVEGKYGDGTGVVKQREVRSALYHLLKGMKIGDDLPGFPPFLRPIVMELAIRATIEFLVVLDKPVSSRPMLWEELPSRGAEVDEGFLASKTRVKIAEKRQSWGERFVAWVIRVMLPPPKLKGPVKRDVEAILQAWAERNAVDGSTPGERMVRPLVASAMWIGNHAEQVRAAIDAIALAVYETARLQQFDREEQMEIVKQAIVMMMADIGFGGPLAGVMVRFFVDIMGDATRDLFEKRQFIPPAA